MTQINYTQNTFTKGIIDENLSARADTNFLIQGANDIVNMNITPQGTIEGRNGLVANKIQTISINKTIDITTTIETKERYTSINTTKYLIHAYSQEYGDQIIKIKYSLDYGNTWNITNIPVKESPSETIGIKEILLSTNDNDIMLLVRCRNGNTIKIYHTTDCINWQKKQEINTGVNIGDIIYFKCYFNSYYFKYIYLNDDGISNTRMYKLENNGNSISSNVIPNNAFIDNFYIKYDNELYLIDLRTTSVIYYYQYSNNLILWTKNLSYQYTKKLIKNNLTDYWIGMLDDTNIYKITNVDGSGQVVETIIKTYTDKKIKDLIYNDIENNWIIIYNNNTIEVSNTGQIEDGTYIIENIDTTNYYKFTINQAGSIFANNANNDLTLFKQYINLIGLKNITITQQKNISIDENLYSVITYKDIISKERYLQLYNINNGNYIGYKFNLTLDNSLTNENFYIISLIKLTDTQLLFSTGIAWYVIDLPKEKIQYNNNLRYFKISEPFRSPSAIQNYLFQSSTPADPTTENKNNFTLATIDKNKIKTISYKDTCSRFLVTNLDKNDNTGIISINTKVSIHVEVPANSQVMLRALWSANIYNQNNGYNSTTYNNQTIFFVRGLYILTTGSINIGNFWNFASFAFDVEGIVIDGTSVNNELLKNYNANQYGLNGSFDNGDIILFNNFITYNIINNTQISFKPIYPSIINRFQNRLVCNNTLLNNYQIYLSKIGDEYTFFATDIEPSSAFSFSLDGNEKILQIETGKKFLISSINGNYIVSNPLNENLKPTNFNINKVSNVIINKNIKPVEYDDKIFYIQNINNNVKFIIETDKIGAVNEAIANISNMDIFKNATILDMLSCPNLNNNGSYLFLLFIKNNKLQLACCYSDKNQEILGWTRWESEIFNIDDKDLSLCKLIYHDNTLYISYELNNDDNYILYFKLSKTEIQDLNVLDVVLPIEQKVITTPISIIDPTIGNIIYKPYKLSNINVAIKNNKNNQPITIYCDDVAMDSKTNNIYELRDYLGNTGYLNKLTFKVLSSDAKLELLGWQTVINYQGDTIK